MSTFLLKIGLYLTLLGVVHLGFAYFSDGKTDDFYLRFTTKQAPSLIVGTSRCAQGINPDSLQDICRTSGHATPMYNYAFTSMSSPIGETYYKAIQAKISPDSKNGLFILGVEPYALGEVPNPTSDEPRESIGQLYDAHFFNTYPNFEYLLKHYNYGWGRMMLTSTGLVRNNNTLHENGWLQIDIAVDSITAHKRALDIIQQRRDDIGKFRLSDDRIFWLNKTIELLKQHGDVYLIRVPICKEYYDFENELVPEFDTIVRSAALNHQITYRDFNDMSHLLTYKDGHHMQVSATAIFSGHLSQWLKQEMLP
jgi:hypothetical protein